MSRRLSQKINNTVLATEPAETIATPRKGRKAVKVEATDAAVKSPAKSTNKVKTEIGHEDENIEVPEDSPKIKINQVKAKAVFEEEKAPKSKKASSKRRVKAEDDEDENEDEDAGGKKVTKKRKTKGEKEAESMPLAARTSIELLKKGMHIGAHVSSAGGAFC